MHIELIDLLRCPEPHEETWLVAAFNKIDGRNIIEAKLGCPVCRREYSIHEGIAIFGGGDVSADPHEKDATTTAAFLDLTSPGKTILLAGRFGFLADEIVEMTQSRAISLNAPREGNNESVAAIMTASRIPLASSSLNGVALDSRHSTQFLVAESARILRPLGRLVLSWDAPLTSDFRELARDEKHVVAERIRDLTTLQRKAGR